MPQLRRGLFVLSVLTLSAGAAHVSHSSYAAATNACAITQAKSLEGKVTTSIRFVNKTAGAVKVYWLDYSGKRVFYKDLAAGASYVQPTWNTHPWVVLNAAGTCIGYVIAPKAEYVITEGSAGPAKKPTFTAVVCTIVVNLPGSTCTAQVADAGIGRSNPPTGTVTFTASGGIVGSSCLLKGTSGSPGIASCTVSYQPPSNLPTGVPPPVFAHYAGDSAFKASSGGTSYKPASVVIPSTITETSAGGIPTALVNQNPFPVSADEVLTVSGISLASASATTVIGRATFSLRPLAVKAATIKLNAKGRGLLAKHPSVHAVLTVTTHAKGKATKTTTRRLVLKAH